ncbi:MAG: hypothetical protein IPO44_08840 [Candidatus Microthrix sp.]|nr:hypothetical protein [Candidatus Microthrix sp.]MBK9559648.1 hypothetical protein [Candidatus Microthrix sp.]
MDVDPHLVDGAWALANQAFGAEFAAGTHFRTINLGFTHRSGERRRIAGHDRHVTGFTVCAYCGAVREVRDRAKNTPSERLHEGWCKVRSGAKTRAVRDVLRWTNAWRRSREPCCWACGPTSAATPATWK